MSGMRMVLESTLQDARYAARGIRSSPLFAAGVAGTIGLGLGILCSAFAIVNAYLLKPIDLPDADQLHALSWDSATARYREFRLSDYEALRDARSMFAGVAAGDRVAVMLGDTVMSGLAVSGNYFEVTGGRAAIGRPLVPSDASAPGTNPVVVLSDDAWRSKYGANPAIVGTDIVLGRGRYEVVGIMRPGTALPGEETASFWVPLTMARGFAIPDPWSEPQASSLFVIARLRASATASQARAWFEIWLKQRFPPRSGAAPVAVHVQPRGTRIPMTPETAAMFTVIVAAFGMVLLVACANVTNMMLARGLGRQRELGVRLSLGASRGRIVRQLVIESLVLAGPAAAVGLGITLGAARAFPLLILATLPEGLPPAAPFLAPFDPDIRGLAVLFAAAVASAVFVGLSPALQVTRTSLARALAGQFGAGTRISRLRTGLVALQIAASALFLVGATGLVQESRRLAARDTGLEYERVIDARVPAELREGVAARLAAHPAIEHVGGSWRPPLAGPLRTLIVAADAAADQAAGFMVVTPEYFPVFGIAIVQGRAFTRAEGEQDAAVVVVSRATARRFWPGRDPIGQVVDIRSAEQASERRPAHARVRVVGVAEDVASGAMMEGFDPTCLYFPTALASPGEVSMLVRARSDVASAAQAIAGAVKDLRREATFEIYVMKTMLGLQTWAFRAFAAAATLLGLVGLLMAFSGTYAVVAFLVTQRTREFGVRIALGATVQRLVRGMMGEVLRIAAVGTLAGAAMAAALGRLSDATIQMMPTFGAWPYVTGTVIVLTATLVAALVPSLRMSRIEPAAALRAE